MLLNLIATNFRLMLLVVISEIPSGTTLHICILYCILTTSDVSHETELTISLYIRTSPQPLTDTFFRQDFCLDVIKIQPWFIHQSVQDEWHPLIGNTGDICVKMCYNSPARQVPLTIKAFELLKVISKGSFGKVQYLIVNSIGDASA